MMVLQCLGELKLLINLLILWGIFGLKTVQHSPLLFV